MGYNFRSIGVREGTTILVNRGCTNFVIYFHLTCGLPIWLEFFLYKDVAAGFWEFPSSTRIFNELQYNLQVWQGFINVSESFFYKDSLFILATQGKKG
jgi:hypothetical protein